MIAKLAVFPKFEERMKLALMMKTNLHYAHVNSFLRTTDKYGPVSSEW